jgi:hypothetical protein
MSWFGDQVKKGLGGALDLVGLGPGGAEEAAKIQSKSAQAGINEQRRQFDALQALLQPYTQAGLPSLQVQQSMLGLGSPEQAQSQINSILQGPQYQAMQQQGNEAILQNASATGGLRGGNTQAALAQFSPQLLSQLLNERYAQLGGMTQLGQTSAAGVGSAGINMAGNVANLLQQQGAAQAGGAMAYNQSMGNLFNMAAQGAGAYMGAGGKF